MTDKITIERETLQVALDALEAALSYDQPYIVQCRAASASLRTALRAEQPMVAQPKSPMEQDAMGIAMIQAWDRSDYSKFGNEAVHPMFQRAFEQGWNASLMITHREK